MWICQVISRSNFKVLTYNYARNSFKSDLNTFLQFPLMLPSLDHIIDCLLCNFQCLCPSRHPTINHRLHNHLSNFRLRQSIPNCPFSMNSKFSPAMKRSEKSEIYRSVKFSLRKNR